MKRIVGLSLLIGIGCFKEQQHVELGVPELVGTYNATGGSTSGVLVLEADGTYRHTTTQDGAHEVYSGLWEVEWRRLDNAARTMKTEVTLSDFCLDWPDKERNGCPEKSRGGWTRYVEVHRGKIYLPIDGDGLYFRKQD